VSSHPVHLSRRSGLAAVFGLLTLPLGCVGALDDDERALFEDASADLGVASDAGAADAGAADAGGPACPDVVATILSSSEGPLGCAQAGCHTAASPASGLDLESPNLVSRLSGMMSSTCGAPYVDPVDPARSLLYVKVGPGPYPCGGRMPIGARLDDTQIACVLDFLESELGGETDAGVADAGPVDMGPADMGGGMDAGAMTELAFEAEAMTIDPPFEVMNDGGASGGAYVTQPSGDINEPIDPSAPGAGRATYTFTLQSPGTTRVFGRIRAGATSSDSFWVRVDDRAWERWNGLSFISEGSWTWDDVHDFDLMTNDQTVAEWDLQAGSHTLEVLFREPNAELDRLIITQDPGFTAPD
jgi:hypothetical protein